MSAADALPARTRATNAETSALMNDFFMALPLTYRRLSYAAGRKSIG
jgi:hypothetical protein